MKRTVEDVMTRTVVVVRDAAPFKELVELMDEFRVSALPVVDIDRRVVGVVSEGDLLLKESLVAETHHDHVFESRRRRRDLEKARGLVAARPDDRCRVARSARDATLACGRR